MKAVITGAAGFIGSHLAARLLRDGHTVVGVDMITDYYDVEIKRAAIASSVAAGIDFREEDLVTMDLAALLHGVDYVFHLAGQPGVRSSWGSEFQHYTRNNITATQRLLEAIKDNGNVTRFVYSSSSSVYGDAERFPCLEADMPQPLSPYGVTKLAGEHLTTLYAHNFGVPTVSLRYFTVYGPGQRPDMAFTRFTLAAHRGEAITLYGTGEQVRDFTFVEDIVEANVLAATVDSTPGSVFNVAGGTSVSVNEVLTLLESIHGSAIGVDRFDAVKGDVPRTGGGTEAITAALGWRPQVTLEQGLRAQYEWARTIA